MLKQPQVTAGHFPITRRAAHHRPDDRIMRRNQSGNGRNLALPPTYCSPSGVAQIYNLLYRRIAFGRAVVCQEAGRITNPRYSRVQLCATVAVSGCARR